MHFPRRLNDNSEESKQKWDAFRKSLDELQPVCRETCVRIAVENSSEDDFADFRDLFQQYDGDFLGLCYDAGHGNMNCDEIPLLDEVKDRLIAIHLHDNNGIDDQHRIPFDGTLKWESLAKVIAASAYAKPLYLETTIGTYDEGIKVSEFLRNAFCAGEKVRMMVEGRVAQEGAVASGQ